MHSIGSISARRTSIARPARSGIAAAAVREVRRIGRDEVGAARRRRAASAQNTVIAVSTRPLSGTGSAKTTSKAEMRSEATISSRPSPAS